MTAKRFTYSKKPHYYGNIIDNGKVLKYTEVVDLLNELNDENQAVKDIINELNSMDFYRDSALLDEYIGKIARILGVDYE